MTVDRTRNKNRFGSTLRWALCLLVSAIVPTIAMADATTDGSVGPSQNLTGNFTVPQSLGSVRGNNLFHSFSRFNVDAGKIATFTTDSTSLRNVITRVTGGERSSIFGAIKVNAASGSTPDFYFLNPAGVLFGSGAAIDVPGGFHVSTAQRLKFSDGFAWETNSATSSSLTVALPETFGFLGGTGQGSITLNNVNSLGIPLSSTTLTLKPGKTLTFTASDLLLDSASVSGKSGNFRFVAQGTAAGDVKIDSPTIDTSPPPNPMNGVIQTNAAMGSIELKNRGEINSSTNNALDAGKIELLANNVAMSRGFQIHADTGADGSAGIIVIKANSLIIDHVAANRITGIFSDANEGSSGGQNSGQIKIVANELSLVNGQAQISSISKSTQANPKAAGTIDILVGKLLIDGGSNIGMSAVGIFGEALSNGKGGLVKVVARDGIMLRNQGQIATNVDFVNATQIGSAGTVIVDANTIEIVGSNKGDEEKTGISSSASAVTNGNPGTVIVTAKDWIRIFNEGKIAITSKSSRALATNPPATLTVSASNIELNHGSIASTVMGSDSGGGIVINVRNQLRLANNSSIRSDAENGNGGPIMINAENTIRLTNSNITSSVNGKLNGNGGNIEIAGKSLVMESGFIQANTKAPLAQGGIVNINVKRLVANGGHAFVGGNKIQEQKLGFDIVGFNVIQAAAPEGVAGNLSISNPDLDISGTLLGLSLPGELGALSQDLCDIGANSSFTRLGRITPYPSSKDPISP